MKKLIALLALLPALAFGQITNPYNPANVNITGGIIGPVKYVKCVNSADDVAINAAIVSQSAAAAAAGGNGMGVVEVWGQCDITSAILPKNYVWIRGGGVGSTILKLHANTAYSDNANVIFAKASASADLTNFAITDLSVDGNSANQLTGTLYGRAIGSVALSSVIPITIDASNNTLTYTLDGVGKTATIANATYSTVQTLVTAINAATQIASTGSYAIQIGGNLSILTGSVLGTLTNISGNGSTTLFGTPTYITSSTDNAYNGITIRGSANKLFVAKNWLVERVESKNASIHGMAVYDGATQFRISGNDFHDNGFRCAHVHASAVSGDQPTTKFDVSRNQCHDDGQAIILPNTSGTGLFAFFDGTRDATIIGNKVWNEPDVAIDISGGTSGSANITDNVIITNNEVMNSGTGFAIQPGTLAAITGVTLANNSARDISYPFILGSAAAGLTITTNSNDTLAVTLAGVTRNVVIPAGAPYASATTLAAAMQTAINTAFASNGSAVTVSAPTAPSGYILMTPIFTNGHINNSFVVAAPGANSGYAGIFGASPTQYGSTRGTATGGCFNITGNATAAWSNFAITGNRANNCAFWGMTIIGGSASVLASKATITGNVIDSAGLDNSVNTGGIHLRFINGFTFTGNSLTNNNSKATVGRQLYLNTNTTLGAFTGNYLDTIVTSGGSAVIDIASTSNYNTIVGNMANRNDGTGNQWNDTGTGNVIAYNMQGKLGAGGFAFSGTKTTVLTVTTGSIGGGALIAGACASGTATVTGASTIMTATATPNTYPGDGNYWYAYVSSASTVTLKVCAAIAGTPTASTYNIRVQI